MLPYVQSARALRTQSPRLPPNGDCHDVALESCAELSAAACRCCLLLLLPAAVAASANAAAAADSGTAIPDAYSSPLRSLRAFSAGVAWLPSGASLGGLCEQQPCSATGFCSVQRRSAPVVGVLCSSLRIRTRTRIRILTRLWAPATQR